MRRGSTFLENLFLLLLAMRMTDQIDWAWYWIALPLLFAGGTEVVTVRMERA